MWKKVGGRVLWTTDGSNRTAGCSSSSDGEAAINRRRLVGWRFGLAGALGFGSVSLGALGELGEAARQLSTLTSRMVQDERRGERSAARRPTQGE